MHKRLWVRRWLVSLLLFALLVGNLPQVVQAAAPADAVTMVPVGMVDNLDDVPQAVVQIESVGTFLDPEDGHPVKDWGGSGFIISPNGVAVTNNHVVAGASYLKVYVAGEKTPRSAHVLGVSECSDLAVIQIAGDHFSYLQWFDQPVKVGLDVYTAGFPLLDPEFTLTKGIIAKAKANGDSSWASVDHVLQHDASINPGNSGGPLLDPNGRVLGINYASNPKTNQFFAIAGDMAQPIIEQLRTRKNLLSIGLNGRALTNGKDFSGIWVASVTSGSVADKAGIKPGDFLLGIENLALGTDGTMKTYCDILRGHNAEDTLSFKVMRNKTICEGQLNGRPLACDQPHTPAPTKPVDAYTYEFVHNAAISGQFPKEWTDRQSADWLNKDNQVIGKVFMAAPDLKQFSATWAAAGVAIHTATGIEEAININQLLDANDVSKNCTYVKRIQHTHTAHQHTYTGAFDVWNKCDGADVTYAYLVAVSEPRGQLVTITWLSTSQADDEAWTQLVNSFFVDSEVMPTPTPDSPTPTATDQPTSAMKPALVDAITAAGWDPTKGQLLEPPEAVLTVPFKSVAGGTAYGRYPLAEGTKEYALHVNVMLGASGDQCEVDLGSISPTANYQFFLQRNGLTGGFVLREIVFTNNSATKWETLVSKTTSNIKLGPSQFNEVVLTVRGNVVTIYNNGLNIAQYTGLALSDSGSLFLSIWRPSSDTKTPTCVFRDVQLYIPNASEAMPTPTSDSPTSTAADQPTSAMKPALVDATTAAGWDPTKGQLLEPPEAVLTVPVELVSGIGYTGVYGQYPLTQGTKEYALHVNVMLGASGDECQVGLGSISANASYQFFLKRNGLTGWFALQKSIYTNNTATKSEALVSKAASNIKKMGQFNEVVLTVRGNVVTIYNNGLQIAQYTGSALVDSSSLYLSIWRPSSDTQTPTCVFRDVQLYIPN